MDRNDHYRFYDPLRNTLDRSSAHWGASQSRNLMKSRSIDQNAMLSRLSNKRRELSPEEAVEIGKSTLIPVDKDLVATNNFEKIHGKQFAVVGVQVREGNPMSASQFKQNYKRGPLHQETIYQLRQKPKQPNMNLPPPSASFTNLKTIYPIQSPFMKSEAITEARTAMSPVRVSEEIKMQPETVKLRNNINGQYATRAVPGAEMLSSMGSSDLALKKSSSKKEYKYNLFSIFDEAVNTNCSSCGKNEIIATKENSSWE